LFVPQRNDTLQRNITMAVGLENEAKKVINRYAKWTAGAGLIPVPLLDVATISGLQIKMLADLSKLYGRPFGKERAKVLVGSLLGSVLPSVLANSSLAAAGTVIKIIPVIGTLVGMAALPAFAYAATKAVGTVFTAGRDPARLRCGKDTGVLQDGIRVPRHVEGRSRRRQQRRRRLTGRGWILFSLAGRRAVTHAPLLLLCPGSRRLCRSSQP
jgi:uncharacterized protein (DUF697 family)